MARARAIFGAALCLAALLAATSPARAQSEHPNERARALFERGVAAIEAGRHGDGADALAESLELLPRVPTAYNLAVAERGTGDFLRAAGLFEALLANEYGELEPAIRREVRRLLEEAKAQVAILRLSVTGGEDIEATVDGEPVGRLEQPGTLNIELNPGKRRLAVRAPERETTERVLEVEPGSETELDVRLVPVVDDRPGVLQLEASEPDVHLAIVGVAEGRGTLSRRLAPGEYAVRVSGEHGERDSRVAVPAGRRIRLVLSPPEQSTGNSTAKIWIWVSVAVAAAAAVGIGTWLAIDRGQSSPVGSPDWPTVEL